MCGACRLESEETGNAHRTSATNLKGRVQMEDLGMDGMLLRLFSEIHCE